MSVLEEFMVFDSIDKSTAFRRVHAAYPFEVSLFQSASTINERHEHMIVARQKAVMWSSRNFCTSSVDFQWSGTRKERSGPHPSTRNLDKVLVIHSPSGETAPPLLRQTRWLFVLL
jgi:hypothetical protein